MKSGSSARHGRGRLCLIAIILLTPTPAFLRGQSAVSSRQIEVSETAGIRRTEYPVNVRLELPRGALRDPSNARLKFTDEVPAQFATDTTWDDKSVRALSVDFNVSIGPGERRGYVLEFGPGVKPAVSGARGLSVTDDADTVRVGPIRFGRNASPLVLAANYAKTNFIGTGRNGVSVTDTTGVQHDLSTAQDLKVEVVKRGPLKVVLRYTGRLPLDQTTAAAFVITLEMPNSKSWLKMSAVVQDPSRRIRSLAFDSPLAFSALPLTWDFGTDHGTYGAFRNATDTAVLLQTVSRRGPSGWTVRTGAASGTLADYESSSSGRAAYGSGHLVDARGAVAFGFADFAREEGTYRIALSGSGQTTFAVEPARRPTEHRLTVYQHFVSTPVPIGAATSPTAMLSPLNVETRP
jgi:hypothetical protein